MKNILVIDDDPAILEVIQLILEENEYSVMTSQNSKVVNGLSILPDLILLDVLLSGEDGRNVIKKLKEEPRTKDIPVIMISAHPSAGDSVFKLGASSFISKPFDIDELLSTVEDTLKDGGASSHRIV